MDLRLEPAGDAFVTQEDLENEANEIVFVQHPPEMSQKEVEELAFGKRHKHGRVTTVPNPPPVYPMAFTPDGCLVLSRTVDKYVVLSQNE